MARSFVVVGESVAVVSDRYDRFFELHEALRGDIFVAGLRHGFRENGIERILSENMFDIGQEQLLMLLLVMEAERDDWLDFGEQPFISVFDQLASALIDRFAEPIG